MTWAWQFLQRHRQVSALQYSVLSGNINDLLKKWSSKKNQDISFSMSDSIQPGNVWAKGRPLAVNVWRRDYPDGYSSPLRFVLTLAWTGTAYT